MSLRISSPKQTAMKITIYEPLKNAKRIKVGIPYENFMMREAIKKMNGSFWHPHQKLWSLIKCDTNMVDCHTILVLYLFTII